MQISCRFPTDCWPKSKRSQDLLISADTRLSGFNHWLLVPLRNTKAVQAVCVLSRQDVLK